MKITIKATNLKLTSDMAQYFEEKIGSLEKFAKILSDEKNFDGLKKRKSKTEVQIEVSKTTLHHKKGSFFQAKIQLKILGKSLRAEVISENIFSAINEVKDEIERQIKKYRGKVTAKYRKRARKTKKDLRLSPEARFYRRGRIREEGI